jgi:HEAT repeat protein
MVQKNMDQRGCRGRVRNVASRNPMTAQTMDSLIKDLASDDWVVRVKAREGLVSAGRKAVEPLTEALASSKQWVRWEAAKALCEIGSPAATKALVEALEDNMFDVRWLSAQGLITIGNNSIVPILDALIDKPESVWLREGAHHVLHDLALGKLRAVLMPVMAALEGVDAAVVVPFTAKAALEAMKHINLSED